VVVAASRVVASRRVRRISKESIPQRLKPPLLLKAKRAKPEGLAYLEAKANAKAKAEADPLRG
jgi:hypothetical protein